MYNIDEFDIKLQIIRHADLEDAEILSINYSQLIVTINDESVKSTYLMLQQEAINRVKELRQ